MDEKKRERISELTQIVKKLDRGEEIPEEEKKKADDILKNFVLPNPSNNTACSDIV